MGLQAVPSGSETGRYGSRLVAYFHSVPCPNCGNERGMELHAVYSSTVFMMQTRQIYHCFSLNCPVCHHGNSWLEKAQNTSSGLMRQACTAPEDADELVNVTLTLQYFRQLGQTERSRYLGMLAKLGLKKLGQKLKDGLCSGTHH